MSEKKKIKFLKPISSSSKIRIPNILAFDCETYGQKNKFYMGSVHGDYRNETVTKVFYDSTEMKNFLINRKNRGSWIFATNLEFDLTRLFTVDEFNKMRFLNRGSHLFKVKYYSTSKDVINFFDSWNYARLSVDKMGKIVGIPKLETPKVGDGKYWRRPDNETERLELERYNIRDSVITYEFVKFLFNTFLQLNTQPKNTIASTTLNCYRRNYQPHTFFQKPVLWYEKMMLGYYGGRCEAIKRGQIKNLNYYDFNSLYPSVMHDNPFPNPNYCSYNRKDRRYYQEYEGVSRVIISSPRDTDIPLIPVRTPDKLLFPLIDYHTGWYTNVELRKAEDEGYTIHKVLENIWFRETDYYFKDFVKNLYDMRNDFKDQGSPMEFVVKLLLNSLYGRWAMKWDTKEKWIHKNSFNSLMYKNYDKIDQLDDMIRMVKKDCKDVPAAVIPIFSIYTTAYGRIKLYDAIKKADTYYYDTDSIITSSELETSSRLGELKREMRIKEGFVVRPKFYAFKDTDDNGDVKIKGLNEKMLYDDFEGFLSDPTRALQKFVRFKESFRRGLAIGEIIDFEKSFKLDDKKRQWPGRFDAENLQSSRPLDLPA